MKTIVAIKRVLDYNVKARIKADHSDVDLSNVKMSMNPFDEIALEEAMRLKEKGVVTEVIAVSIGTAASQETLRTALAFGADTAILVESNERIYPLTAAEILAKLVEQEQATMVLLGKQAIDDDSNQTGQMLAARLNWPQATFISSLHIEGNTALVAREVDEGLEHLTLPLPAVLTTDLRLNEPRYISLPNIMKAKSKPLKVIPMADLGVEAVDDLEWLSVEAPPARKAGIKVSSVEELLEKLRSEQKVIDHDLSHC